MGRQKRVARCEGQRTQQGIFQFTNVPRPAILCEKIEDVRIDIGDVAAVCARETFHKIRYKILLIFGPFAQGWNVNLKNLNTIQQVAAKLAGRAHRIEIAMRGENETTARGEGAVRSERYEFLIL